jgi:hypothetical protein
LSYAPVAQLDRAIASGAIGREFESLRAHQFLNGAAMKDLLEFPFALAILLIVYAAAIWLDTRTFEFVFRWRRNPRSAAFRRNTVRSEVSSGI